MYSNGSKGAGPKVAQYAEGGPVMGRTRDFLKESSPFQTDVETSKYGKGGPNSGSPNPEPHNKATGHGPNCGCKKCA